MGAGEELGTEGKAKSRIVGIGVPLACVEGNTKELGWPEGWRVQAPLEHELKHECCSVFISPASQ